MISLTFSDLKRSDQGHRLLRLNFYLIVKVYRTSITMFLPDIEHSFSTLNKFEYYVHVVHTLTLYALYNMWVYCV